MLKQKFLLFPLVVLLFLFVLDKIFILDIVKKYIKSDFTYIYYESKEELLKILTEKTKKNTKDKKLMIILGSSRLLYFDAKQLEEIYPEWDIYNFSSAVTTPAYYYYYLERILDRGIKPDLIVLETDSNQFNKNSPVFKGSNLTYSFDLLFVLRHIHLFGNDNFSYFIGKYLFASGKHKPNLDTAYKRLTDPAFLMMFDLTDKTRNFLVENKGHAMSPVETFFEKNFTMLDATSKRTVDWLYTSYKDSEMQFRFYEMILDKVKNAQIPMIVLQPQNSIPLESMLKDKTSVLNWEKQIHSLSQKREFYVHKMNQSDEYYCNAFVDGGHIAKDCYHPFMRFIMIKYYKLTQ